MIRMIDWAFPAAALGVGLAVTVLAENELSKEDNRWLEQEVAVLITPEEIETFKEINSEDREVFKEIFWARRDPDPSTPQNEFRVAFEAAVETADRQLGAPARRGSLTDMGRVFVLLGRPDQQDQEGETNTEHDSDSLPKEPTQPSNSRVNEETDPDPSAFPDTGFGELGESSDTSIITWVYASNPRLGIPDGLRIQFRRLSDFGYHMLQAERIEPILEKLKTVYLSNPSLTYERDARGRLVDPNGDEGSESPVRQILGSMRNTQTSLNDLPFQTTVAFFRATDGAVYIPILFDLDDAPLTWRDHKVQATVFGLAENADGDPAFQFEEQTQFVRYPNGGYRYEIPIQLEPGPYKLYLGIRDEASGGVGTQIQDLQVPDYSHGELVLSSVIIYGEGQQVSEPAGTPGHAFQFGSVKFQPDRTFALQDTLGFFFFVYGFGFDANNRPHVTAQYTFYKDGTPKGHTKEELLLTDVDHAVGNAEIPLSGFDPGTYRLEIKVRDRVRHRVTITDVDFVVEGETGTS